MKAMRFTILSACAFSALSFSAFAQADAKASQAEAVRKFPDLAKAGSDFNKAFVARLQTAKATQNQILTRSDWPMILAEAVAVELGVKTFREEQRRQKTADEQKLFDAAAIIQPEDRKAFDNLYFGDSETLTQYKLAHSTKLKGEAAKEADDSETVFYALDVGGRSYAVQTAFEGGKLYEVSFVQTFGDISTHFQRHNLKWGVFPGDLSQYHSAIKESWQVLRDIAITRFGQPTRSLGYPNPLKIENFTVTFSDVWELGKRRVTLGMVQAIDDVGPILSVSDAEVIKKLNDIEDAKRKAAVKAAADGF